MTARELLKEARNWIESLCDVYSDEIGREKTHEGYEIKAHIDAYLAAPSESAMGAKQLAGLLLSRTRRTYEQSGEVEILPAYSIETATELIKSRDAALIEGLQRRVPRKMLETIYSNGGDDIMSVCAKESIEATAAKYGVEVE